MPLIRFDVVVSTILFHTIMSKKMKFSLITCAVMVALCTPVAALSAAENQAEKNQPISNEADNINKQQIKSLEQRLLAVETKINSSENEVVANNNRQAVMSQQGNNIFNPAISVIFDGVYASYNNHPEDYKLPGYALGGEAELSASGFSLGHSEIIMSSNVDDKFYGQLTLAIAEHDGETEIELEEAFFETLALGNGFTLRGGRFYSGIGYLNQQHQHAWDFYDAPLIYRGLFGNQYRDDGIRLSYIAATNLFLEVGAEAFSGSKYPAGGQHDDVGSWTSFVNLGGDVGVSHSWQAGLSYWQADDISREYGGHAHGGAVETPVFKGDTNTIGLNAIYKWAPNGNYREQNFKLQFEYFKREDEGDVVLENSNPLEASSLNGKQDGWYLQAIWQFAREWRVGARYDSLSSDNRGSDVAVLNEAGLVADGHMPTRSSVMAEWKASEFSRIRLQYNYDDSYQQSDQQLFLQYTMSLGAHGAHAF